MHSSRMCTTHFCDLLGRDGGVDTSPPPPPPPCTHPCPGACWDILPPKRMLGYTPPLPGCLSGGGYAWYMSLPWAGIPLSPEGTPWEIHTPSSHKLHPLGLIFSSGHRMRAVRILLECCLVAYVYLRQNVMMPNTSICSHRDHINVTFQQYVNT